MLVFVTTLLQQPESVLIRKARCGSLSTVFEGLTMANRALSDDAGGRASLSTSHDHVLVRVFSAL